MLGSLNAVGQRLPAGQHVCGHRIQKQHPVQTGVAVHSGELLGHPATARIAMGAHQSGTPTMASQQPVTTEPLHRHQAIAELKQAMGKQGDARGINDQHRRQGPAPSNQGNSPSTNRAITHSWGRPVSSCAPGQWLIQLAMVITRPAN